MALAGSLHTHLSKESLPQAVLVRCVVRLQLHSPLQGSFSLSVELEAEQGLAQLGLAGSIAGQQRSCLREVRQALLQLALPEQGRSQRILVQGLVWLQRYRRLHTSSVSLAALGFWTV